MSLAPGFQSARDLLEKLRRDLDLLEREVTSDGFFNFVVTAYSLFDSIENDGDVPAPAKTALRALRQSTKLEVCRDLANSFKHFQLNVPSQRNAITASTGGIKATVWAVAALVGSVKVNRQSRSLSTIARRTRFCRSRKACSSNGTHFSARINCKSRQRIRTRSQRQACAVQYP